MAFTIRDSGRMSKAIDWMAKRGRGVVGHQAYVDPIFNIVSSGQLSNLVQLLGRRA